MKEILVTNCDDCPLREFDYRYCHLDWEFVGLDCDEGRLPVTCKLREGEIHLKLKEPSLPGFDQEMKHALDAALARVAKE